jgi:hypothetical protein
VALHSISCDCRFFCNLGVLVFPRRYFLWQQLEASKPAFELCTLLFARHRTMPFMEAAVALTNHTLLRCEQVLSY